MTREELEKVFDWLEKNMNKQNYFEFVLTDRNQITAYWKNTRDGFAQFYIKPILELIKEDK